MRGIDWKRHKWGVALGVAAWASQACASVCPHPTSAQMAERVVRMDGYFYAPRSPQTYRALSGMGDPQITADDSAARYDGQSEAETLYMKKLFPEMDIGRYAYRDFGHCRTGSPLKILTDRITQLGANHPYVQQWIKVERVVLSACGPGNARPASLPAALLTDNGPVAQLQAKDRAYQMASMLFYENDLPAALEQFDAIARDRRSPHRGLGVYMAVAIRAGTDPRDGRRDKPMVAPAQSLAAIRAILRDPSLSDIHAITAQLIGWIGAWSDDPVATRAQIREALNALAAPLPRLKHSASAHRRYAAALSDINFLHHDFADPAWWLNGAVPRQAKDSRAMADAAQTNAMAAWVLFPSDPYIGHPWALVETGFPPSALRDYLKHHADPSQPANVWNRAVLTESYVASSVDDRQAALVDAEILDVQSCGGDQAIAALPFDFYHLVRRLWMSEPQANRGENFAAALRRLKDYPFKSTASYRAIVHDSLQYLMTKGYLAMARRMRDELTLDHPADALQDLTQLLIVLAEDENHLAHAFNAKNYETDEYLNGIAIDELWRLAARRDLARDQRALFARIAWTRLYALGRIIDGKRDRLMRDLNPELVATWRSPEGEDIRPDDRIVLKDVLTAPGLNLVIEDGARKAGKASGEDPGLTGMDRENHNDSNWWCAWELDRHQQALDRSLHYSFGDLDAAPQSYGTLTIRQSLAPALRESFVLRSIDPAELRALSRIDCAPKMLANRVLAWVKHPGWFEPRDGQDEALANAIVVARWGCNRQGSHAAYTRAAYRLLHSQFRDTAAARRTRYWYACPGVSGGCPAKDNLATTSRH